MVFTDYDFLFGSSYISQNFSVNSLRAADLHVIADKRSNSLFSLAYDNHSLIDEIIQRQCEMNSGRRYYEDFPYFLNKFEKTIKQKDCFYMWKNHPDTMQKSFHLYSIYLENFFEVYSQYCKMNVSDSKQKDIKADLEQLWQAGTAAFVFVRFLQYLSNSKGKYHSSYCRHFLQWLRHFFFTYKECITIFIAFDDKNISGVCDTLPEFQKALFSQSIANEDYPNLLSENFIDKLTLSEEMLVESLKNHPLCRCINEVQKQLQYVWIRKISAYYLFSVFHHTKNPKIPFQKSTYAASEMNFDLKPTVMSEDTNAVRPQKASIYLFSALKLLCYAVFYDE